MSYPVVELPDESGVPVQYYKAEILGAILYVQRDLVDCGVTTIEAEIEALCKPRLVS